ncbi:MAG TPA: hypothetical protein VF585_08740 [Chthoniobacterales bacterium]|jgi:hypothetical protein
MPKFNKDQIQKIFLSAILFVALIYGYFTYLLGPVTKKKEGDTKAIAETQVKIEEALKQIKLGKNAVERATASVATMEKIESLIPKEAAIAWFPPLVNQFFAKRGIPKVGLQLRSTTAVPGEGLERFKYINWDASFPPSPFFNVISALSDFENEMPLLAILSVRVGSAPTSVEDQGIVCEFRTLLK